MSERVTTETLPALRRHASALLEALATGGVSLIRGRSVREYERDQRGFAIFGTFKDDYHGDVTVKQSSDVGGHVWLFTSGGNVKKNDGSALLTPQMARDLARLLHESADWTERRYGL